MPLSNTSPASYDTLCGEEMTTHDSERRGRFLMNEVTFPREPVCEVCKKEGAYSFSFLSKGDVPCWKFTGECTNGREEYYIVFEKFFNSPAATVDWLAHLQEKSWMDWQDFGLMFWRFRQATESFSHTT